MSPVRGGPDDPWDDHDIDMWWEDHIQRMTWVDWVATAFVIAIPLLTIGAAVIVVRWLT